MSDLETEGDEEGGTVVLTFRVPGELEGQRLDRFLEWRIPRLSRERAREIVEACARREDGGPRAPWERVRAKEIVRLVRERFMLLKSCVMAGKDDAKVPYLYHLSAGGAAAATH